MNRNTNDLIFDFLTKEILQQYFSWTVLENSLKLDEFIKNFVYLHDLNNLMVEEDLTDDFEPSGHIKYNINKKSELILELIFVYDDGDLNCIDYDIKDYELFNKLLINSINIASETIANKIRSQFEYFEK